MKKPREIHKVKFLKSGQVFRMNRAEKTLCMLLMQNSPQYVAMESLCSKVMISEEHIRKLITRLRPIATLENCIIESNLRGGYRIVKVEAYDFSISN